MSLSRGGLLPGLLALWTGCQLSGEYPQCRQDSDCKSDLGELCVDRVCQNCSQDDDCDGFGDPADGPFRCRSFRCAPASDDVDPNENPTPCVDRTQCEDDLACVGGLCAMCMLDMDCEPGVCDRQSQRCIRPRGPEDCGMDEVWREGECVGAPEERPLGTQYCDLQEVSFRSGEEKLTKTARSELRTFAKCAARRTEPLLLEVRSGRQEPEEYSLFLSDVRGSNVRAYLVANGVDEARITLKPVGALDPSDADLPSVRILWQAPE